MVKTIADITVEVINAKKVETGIEIELCFTTLDDGEWYPGPGYLVIGDEEIPPDEYEFTQEIHADGKLPGMRCAAICYRMVDTLAIEFPMQFELGDVHIIPCEMPACRNLQYRLDTGPKAQEYGITVNCTEESTQGDMDVKLVDFNKSITQEKAQAVLDAIVTGKVTGPWLFTIDHIE